jgi:phospholipid-binding lipoprotein MlaA
VKSAAKQTAVLVAALLCGLSGCASTGGPEPAGPTEPNPDPWESLNRRVFAFNDGTDRWAIEPVSKVWNFVVPRRVQWSIKNIYDNAWMPAVFGNHILQAHPKEAFLEDLPRLIVNTTIGLAGIFDVASRMGIDDNYTDFGVTMGRWGAPPGPYFVIPLLGPSSVRDGIGRVADGYSSPYTYFIPWWGFFVIRGTELLNLRSLYMEEIAQSKAESFDFYLFMRDAWVQNRRHRVREARRESTEDTPEADDLYYFEDDYEDEEEGDADAAVAS